MTGMIPTDIYSEDLRSFLWKFQAISEEDKAVHILLLKICGTILHKRPDDSRTLDFIGKVSLNQEEKDLILKYDLINCANCEVKARCCDVLFGQMGFEGDPFSFCIFGPLFFCALLSDELVKDEIRVDGLAFFCNYDLPLEGGVDSGFQQVLGKFFV